MGFQNDKLRHSMVCMKNISACLCCYVVVLWFSLSVLMKCFTRGIHWGAAHTTCCPRLGKWIYRNHFSDMTLNVQSERVKWKWDFMALHYQCCSRNWRNVCFFSFFLFLLRGRWNCWYTVHTNTDKALHAIEFQGHYCCYGGLSILYCLLAFPWLSEHPMCT